MAGKVKLEIDTSVWVTYFRGTDPNVVSHLMDMLDNEGGRERRHLACASGASTLDCACGCGAGKMPALPDECHLSSLPKFIFVAQCVFNRKSMNPAAAASSRLMAASG